jgi:hypothetical protein
VSTSSSLHCNDLHPLQRVRSTWTVCNTSSAIFGRSLSFDKRRLDVIGFIVSTTTTSHRSTLVAHQTMRVLTINLYNASVYSSSNPMRVAPILPSNSITRLWCKSSPLHLPQVQSKGPKVTSTDHDPSPPTSTSTGALSIVTQNACLKSQVANTPLVCRPPFSSSHLQPNISFFDKNRPQPEHH